MVTGYMEHAQIRMLLEGIARQWLRTEGEVMQRGQELQTEADSI